MIAIASGALILTSLVLILRWLAARPLVLAITNGIDAWADEVHGGEPDRSA